MRGNPKRYSTKQDIENGLAEFPEQTKAYLQGLLDDRYRIIASEELPQGNEGQHNPPLLRVRDGGSEMDAEGNVIVQHLWQETWEEDPNCMLFRMGLTVEEVEAMISG